MTIIFPKVEYVEDLLHWIALNTIGIIYVTGFMCIFNILGSGCCWNLHVSDVGVQSKVITDKNMRSRLTKLLFPLMYLHVSSYLQKTIRGQSDNS